jgi:uncharacterized membrane protein YhaH (DUF805 family)
MGFVEAISSGFSKYVTFSGRAARSEFWYWVLFAVIVGIVSVLIDRFLFPGNVISPVNLLASLALFLPGIAVAVRRLHDLDRTGWWFLLSLTVIGVILLIIWDCMKGTAGPNRYGPDPLGGI